MVAHGSHWCDLTLRTVKVVSLDPSQQSTLPICLSERSETSIWPPWKLVETWFQWDLCLLPKVVTVVAEKAGRDASVLYHIFSKQISLPLKRKCWKKNVCFASLMLNLKLWSSNVHGKKSLNNQNNRVFVSISSEMGGVPVTLQMQGPGLFFGLHCEVTSGG